MKELVFRTPYNPPPITGEVNTMASRTIPDETMSIREIVYRFTKNLPVTSGVKVPIYEGDDEFTPDLRTLDLVERQQMAENARKELGEIASREAKRRAEYKAEKDKEAAEWAEFRKKLADKSVEGGTNAS